MTSAAGDNTSSPSWPPDPELGFAFRLAHDAGRLTLEDRRFFDWLDVERLELEVPGLRPPVDMSSGAQRFQNRRTQVASAALSVGQRQLDHLIASLAPRLVSVGADRVTVRPSGDHLSVCARFRDGRYLADLVATVRVIPRGGPLAFVVDRSLAFGFLPTPAPILAHRLLTAITGAAEQPAYPGAPIVRGLGFVEIDTLSALLWHLFPPRGWRLPDPRNVELIAARPTRGGMVARFARGGEGASPDQRGARLLASLARHRDAEQALVTGHYAEALQAYRTALAGESGDHDFVYRRLLALASSKREHFAFAIDLARDALSRWPGFPEAHAAVGSARVEQGDELAAAERYQILAESAAKVDDEAAIRAGLVGARLFEREAPDRATALYEVVAELRPGQSEATDALMRRYRSSGRTHDLVRLLRSRIASSTNPRAQLADRIALAELYLGELEDVRSAGDVAERAAKSEADDGSGEHILARALSAAGESSAAVEALLRAAAKFQQAGDERAQLDALLQAAGMLSETGADERALSVYDQALAVRPDSSDALAGAAATKMRRHDHAGAAVLWQRLVETSTDVPTRVAGYALELGACLLSIGETAAGIEQFEWAGARGNPLVRGRAHLFLADEARKDGDLEAAVAQLEQAIEVLDVDAQEQREVGNDARGELVASVHLQRAELFVLLERSTDAAVDFQRAYELSPLGSPRRIEAARALIDLARKNDDTIALRRWLDSMVEADVATADRVRALLDRARLGVETTSPEREAIIADLDAALAISEDAALRAEALELKAALLDDSEDTIGRAETLTQRIELATDPFELAVARTQAARAWLDADHSENALKLAQEATLDLREGAAVDYSEAWITLGDAAWRRRAWSLVIDASDRLRSGTFDAHGETIATHVHRAGIAHSESGDLEGAAECFEEVVRSEATPNELRGSTYRLLAGIYERLDRIGEAASALEAFAEDDSTGVPDSSRADAWYRAGELHRRTGNDGEAAERCLESSLQLVSDHLPALDALERLKRAEEDYERVAVILGRKIAATARHPNRQKALLARLADLHHLRLGRTDVARQSYARALDIDPGFRPALRFVVADARERADLPALAGALEKLAYELESDLDLSDDATSLAEERVEAAVQLAELAADLEDLALDEPALAALEANLTPDSYDDRILEGMERVLRTRGDWRAVADVLGQRAANSSNEEALSWDLERVDLLSGTLADRGAALAAARAALSRHPDNETLLGFVEALQEKGATAAAPVVPGTDHVNPAELRTEADKAFAAGDYQAAAELLETLVNYQPLGLDRAGTRHFGNRAARGELFLQLADLYYDHLDDPTRARESMRRAAEAFGSGARRDATLRLLASEAASAEAPDIAAQALESIEPHRLTGNDRLQLARALSKMGRDQRAIEVLEQARVRGSLTDDGAQALSHLYRERERKTELAESLERGAKESPPEIAEVRLREALNIFENALASVEGAERVRKQIFALGAGPDRVPAADDLERAADAALQDGDSAVAADLLSRAVHERARTLASESSTADSYLLAALDRLRRVTYTIAPSPDLGGTGHFEALVRGLMSAATVSGQEAAIALSREAGSVKRNQLRDPRGAADALARAFTFAPEHSALFAELSEALRESGDHTQLIAAYEIRLESLEGPARARALRELARVVRTVSGEGERVRKLLDEANDVEPDDDPSAAERESQAAAELEKGVELENAGKRDEAIAHYYASFAKNPSDNRPLQALDRLYGALGDTESQANVLGQLIEQTEGAQPKATLWHRRAKLYRDVLRRDQDAYRCMKEAYANDPESSDIAHALRTMAMVRGEWPLAAELLYREIASAPDDRERAALQLELALIYDEKLIDPAQAIRNYSHALELDPSIPAAPAPLARLYEHVGDFEAAAQTFEMAAGLARDDEIRREHLRRAAMAAEQAGNSDAAQRLFGLAGELESEAPPDTKPSGTRRDSTELDVALQSAESDDARLEVLHKFLAAAVDDSDEPFVRKHARAILAVDPGDSTAYSALSDLAVASANWTAAAELLERRARAVDDEAERASLFFKLGECYQGEIGDTPRAVRAYEAALSSDPKHAGALDALAQIAYLRSDWEQARQLFARIDPSTSTMAPAMLAFRRGEIAEMLGLDSEAAGAFASASSLAPDSEPALTALVRAAVRIGDLPVAIDAARSRLSLISAEDVGALANARLQLAELCDASNDIVTAIYYYEMALAEDPNNRRALENLVTLYAAHGDHQGAVRTLRSLIAIASELGERAERHYTLGEIFRANVGDHEAAAGEYLKAVDLNPGHAPTLRRLLDYYWSLDDSEALVEIATDLHERDALIVIETPSPTLARVMLTAALVGSPLAVRIADSLPGDVNRATASAMTESVEVGRSASADELVAAANWLAEHVNAVRREAVADHLGSGAHKPAKAALYAAILGS